MNNHGQGQSCCHDHKNYICFKIICMIMVFTSQLQNENTFFASFFINILLNWIGLKLTECIISSIYNVGKYKICMVSL